MKRHLAPLIALGVLVTVGISGCAPAASTTMDSPVRELVTKATSGMEASDRTPESPGTPRNTAQIPTATSTPPLVVAEPVAGAEAAVALAKEDLAAQLGTSMVEIRLLSAEAVDWPDSSLGCPRPGMMYAQVATPGYLLVLQAEGRSYSYHTDEARLVVLCMDTSASTGGSEEAAVKDTPGQSSAQLTLTESMVAKAREDLAGRLSLGVEQVNLLEAREVTWPDSSLGCPKPGIVYDQSPQDGLLIRLGAGGSMYFYHSGGGEDPFLCEDTLRVLPRITPRSDEFVPPPDSDID